MEKRIKRKIRAPTFQLKVVSDDDFSSAAIGLVFVIITYPYMFRCVQFEYCCVPHQTTTTDDEVYFDSSEQILARKDNLFTGNLDNARAIA